MNCCEEHENTVVVYSGDECPLCKALAMVEQMRDELEQATAEPEEDEADDPEKEMEF